jgi:hypothetical protein
VKNQDIEETMHDIFNDLRDLKGELFNIKIRHEINVASIKTTLKIGLKMQLIN